MAAQFTEAPSRIAASTVSDPKLCLTAILDVSLCASSTPFMALQESQGTQGVVLV